jgi:hypothetical protein
LRKSKRFETSLFHIFIYFILLARKTLYRIKGLKPDAFKLWVQLHSTCTGPPGGSCAAGQVAPPWRSGYRVDPFEKADFETGKSHFIGSKG